MRFIPTAQLEPGMITAKAIYDNSLLVTAANQTLTPKMISAVRRGRLQGLFIYDEYSDYEHLQVIVNDELRYRMVKELQDFNIDQVIYLTNQIVDSILQKKSDLLIDLNTLAIYDNSTYQHSIDVTTLATTCGVGLGLSVQNLQYLALSAALHDIGKQAIPKAILNKEENLTDEEMELMKQHPKIAYEMLYNNNNISSYVRSAILSHHENWDGSGYPNHLKGTAIPIFARIIHVADVYDALIKKRSYKEAYSYNDSIEYLMAHCSDMFDIECVKSFIKYLVVYPVGSTVILSNGKQAHVIKNRSTSVTRPVVMTEDKTVLDLAYDLDYLSVSIAGFA